MSKRNKVIQLKLTEEEFRILKEGLEKRGVTLLQLLRKSFKLPEPKPMKGSQAWLEQKEESSEE